jgi:membrane-bound metal-dependent hydrolase YbcI (DUF457 family)
MMGTSHTTSGALGWLLIAPAAAAIVAAPMEGKVLVAGMIACAGAALLPDLDHPKSTIAYTLGPVTHGLARLVNLLAGGHRQATHSILFAVLMGVGTQLLVMWSDVAALIIFWCMTALALKSLKLTPPKTSNNIKGLVIAGEATLVAWLVSTYLPGEWWWLGIAVGLGCLIHIFGDCLTPEGVPFFWPARWRGSIPLIPHTGSFLEVGILTPLMTIGVLYLLYRQFAGDLPLPWN